MASLRWDRMQYMAASAAKYPPPNMPGVPTATGCQQPRQVLDTAGELAAMYLLNAVSDAVQHPTDKRAEPLLCTA